MAKKKYYSLEKKYQQHIKKNTSFSRSLTFDLGFFRCISLTFFVYFCLLLALGIIEIFNKIIG